MIDGRKNLHLQTMANKFAWIERLEWMNWIEWIFYCRIPSSWYSKIRHIGEFWPSQCWTQFRALSMFKSGTVVSVFSRDVSKFWAQIGPPFQHWEGENLVCLFQHWEGQNSPDVSNFWVPAGGANSKNSLYSFKSFIRVVRSTQICLPWSGDEGFSDRQSNWAIRLIWRKLFILAVWLTGG